MPDTLKIYRDDTDTTGLDLSSYVDITEGGINPGDESVREPVMSQGSLGYGEQVVHVRMSARPFTVALLLAGSSQDTLAALQQSIEGYLAGARPVIEWARQGASSSTWFRVRYGRVLGDARYDQKRESQTRYAKRLMVVTAEPYGTGSRVLAANVPVVSPPTGAGWASAAGPIGVAPSNPALGMLPSIGGDAPVRWRIGFGATGASAAGDGFSATGIFPGRIAAGLTATPYSITGLNAASAQSPTTARIRHAYGTAMGPTTYIADDWAPGGFALQFTGTRLGSGAQIPLNDAAGPALITGAWAPTAPPPGLYRLYAAIRSRQHTTGGSSLPARVQVLSAGIRGPVATLAVRSPSQWAWYDVGDVLNLNDLSINFGFPTGFTGVASPMFNVAAFAAIPKHTRYWEIDNQYGVQSQVLAVGADSDDGVSPVGVIVAASLAAMDRQEDVTQRSSLRGALPVTAALPSGGTSAWYLAAIAFRDSLQANIQATSSHHNRENLTVSIAAWDRYTFSK